MKGPNPVALYISLLSLTTTTTLAASACVAFDAGWNLLAFNLGGKDYNAGTKDSWSSGTPTDITSNGRPPFNTNAPTCHLSQAGNSIYVVGADQANPASIYIYNVAGKSWSTQATDPGSSGYDPQSSIPILDRNTDVIYAYSKGSLYLVRMEDRSTAKPEAIAWEAAGTPDFAVDGYDPVMGLGMNHIHFLNVPGGKQGDARIYVIHFGEYQPEPQKYGDFPNQHGQTASVFLESREPQHEFIYIPDDGSSTYVVNVVTNTTQTLAGPPQKEAGASYFASPDTFVQLSSSGIAFLPYSAEGGASANSGAKWTSVAKFNGLAVGGGGSGGGGGGNSASPSPSGSPTGSGPGTSRTGASLPTTAPNGTNSGNSGNGNGNGAAPGAKSAQSVLVLGLSLAIGLGSVGVALL